MYRTVLVVTTALVHLSPFLHAQEPSGVGAVKVHLGRAGVDRYQPGRWSVVGLQAANPSAADKDVKVSVYLDKDTRTRFTRQLWLPGGSTRKTWLPIRPPENAPSNQKRIDVSKLPSAESGPSAQSPQESRTPLIEEATFTFEQDVRRTGVIGQLHPLGTVPEGERLNADADELVVVTRLIAGDDPVLVGLEDRMLPPYPEAYEGLDQIVVSGDRIANDSAGLIAVRSWLARGGRMWIMLDRVRLATVEALLGNGATIEIVDHVELNSFTLETPSLLAKREEAFESWESEQPVEFVRVLVDDAEVHSRIDGWPAAFSLPFCRGQVTFTTLGPRGWTNENERYTAQQADEMSVPAPLRGTRELALEFHQSRMDNTFDTETVKPLVAEQIGYRVPSRRLAGLVLGLNCVVLAAAGFWLGKRRKLELVVWVLPITIFVTTTILVVLGAMNAASVPATAASFQLVDVSSETSEAHGTTLVAFYSPDSRDLPLEAARRGSVIPETSGMAGVVKELVCDDQGRRRWEGIRLPTGAVRICQAQENYVLKAPLEARGQFGPEGLRGSLVGAEQIGSPSDALIAWPPAPNTKVHLTSDRQFQCGEPEVLADDEFLTSALLSDEQQRRQRIYRQLLDPADDRDYPLRSTLLVWGREKAPTVRFPEGFESVASTLYAIPLSLQKTPAGSNFLVPSSFVRMENAGGKWGYTTAYNPRTGRFLEDATSTPDAMFRFVLPRQVLPCRVDRATILVRLRAPSRFVDLTALSDGTKVRIKRFESPGGLREVVVREPELLQLDEAGGLMFGITVSETMEQQERARREAEESFDDDADGDEHTDNSPWQIDYLRVQVAGQKL